MLKWLRWKCCPASFVTHLPGWNQRVSVAVTNGSGLRLIQTWKSLRRSLTHLTHSVQARFIWGPGPPTCHRNGRRLSCINTCALTHFFNFLTTAKERDGLIWAAIPLRWRRRASVFNVFSQREPASHTVYRQNPAFNAGDWRIKTVVVLPMRKGWLTHPSYTHHTCRKSLAGSLALKEIYGETNPQSMTVTNPV